MRRLAAALTIGIAALSGVPAAAQTGRAVTIPAVLIAPISPPVTIRRSDPAAVVERLLSFDADGDRRVTNDELPERMQGLTGRVDSNGDGAITAVEAAAAVDRKPAVADPRPFTIRNGMPALADVVHDLTLPQPTHDRAMALVRRYQVPRNVNDPSSMDAPALHAAMWTLLGEEDYGNFAAAASRIGTRTEHAFTVTGGAGQLRPPAQPAAR